MSIILVLKETIDKISEVTTELKSSSTTLLGFVVLLVLILVAGIVGIAAYSKLPLWSNLVILAIFLFIFCFIVFKTFTKALKNPWKFIFNQNAYIIAMREKLMDDRDVGSYFTDEQIEQNSEAPLQLQESKPSKKE